MKKTILTDWEKLDCTDAPLPEIGEEEALVKLVYGGICGTDVHVYLHNHKTASVPRVLGHEYCGIVEKVNSKRFPDLRAGDFVTSHPLRACGYCRECLSGNENACKSIAIYGIHTDGCFAEYLVVPTQKLYRIDPSADPKVASLIEPLAVAVHDVRLSGLKRGDDVFVISAGPIGVLIALVARLAGANNVVLSEINEYRIRIAQSLGLSVLNPTEEDFERRLMEQTNGKGYEVVFEASGSRAGTALCTKVSAQRASVVVVGVPQEPYPVDTGAILAKELKMIGVRIHPQSDFAEAVRIVNSGVLNKELAALVTHVFPLEEIQKAILFSIEDQEHYKVLLQP